MMKRPYFNSRIKKKVNPTYSPSGMRPKFDVVGDETRYKQRLHTDPKFAIDKKNKEIHVNSELFLSKQLDHSLNPFDPHKKEQQFKDPFALPDSGIPGL